MTANKFTADITKLKQEVGERDSAIFDLKQKMQNDLATIKQQETKMNE